MKIILYKYSGENIRLDKTGSLSEPVELDGYMRSDSSIINPNITIELGDEIIGYNYLYIESFKRYYYITNIIAVTATNIWELSLKVDVLMSFKESILQQTAYVGRNEFDYNKLLPDKTVTIQTGYTRSERFGISGSEGSTYFDAFTQMDANAFVYIVRTYAGKIGGSQPNDFVYKPWYGENEEGVVGDYTWAYENLLPTPNVAISPYNNCNYVYAVTYNELCKLIEELDEFDFGSVLFGQKMDFILDIRLYPRKLASENSANYGPLIVNGRYTEAQGVELFSRVVQSDIEKPAISNVLAEVFDRDNIFTDKNSYDSYLGHSPYFKIQLYLPYYGIVDIESELFINFKYLYIDIAVDFNNGSAKYLLSMGNEFPRTGYVREYFKTIEFQMGVDVPLGGTNTAEQINTAIFKSIQLGASVASGGFGISAGVLNSLPKAQFKKKEPYVNKRIQAVANENTKQLAADSVGVVAGDINQVTVKPLGINYQSNGFGSFTDWSCPKIITYAYKPNENPDNYAGIVGKPLNAVRQLSDLHGYTSVIEMHIENVQNATFDEIDIIESELKSGIII